MLDPKYSLRLAMDAQMTERAESKAPGAGSWEDRLDYGKTRKLEWAGLRDFRVLSSEHIKRGLELWLSWQHACPAHMKPRI